MMSKRVFIGMMVSDEIKEKIRLWYTQLTATGADLKLVPMDNLHLTLQFLGEVGENTISEIKEKVQSICAGIKPFSIIIGNLRVFPDAENIKVVWIGAESKELVLLTAEINRELGHLREDEYEDKIPHLTIARVKSGKNTPELNDIVVKNKGISFGSMVVDKVFLFESILT